MIPGYMITNFCGIVLFSIGFKIMTMVNEDDLHTYENRFIATLVRRLVFNNYGKFINISWNT